MKQTISAVVHTYNAERYLDEVLSALEGFDELLVIDNDSTDRTVEIAHSHGAKVLTKPREHYRIVEAHREWGIRQAKSDWVLEVDADEIVPLALRNYLYKHIEENPEPHGLEIPIKNYFMGRWMRCYYPDYILRFFWREGTTWPQYVHSRPSHPGPLLRIPKDRTDLAFVHLANESVSQTFAKMNSYTEMEKERRAPQYRRWQIFTAPTFRFFKTYILKGGWREGMPGFIHAMHDAIYRFAALAKIEEQRICSRDDERQIDIDRRKAAE